MVAEDVRAIYVMYGVHFTAIKRLPQVDYYYRWSPWPFGPLDILLIDFLLYSQKHTRVENPSTQRDRSAWSAGLRILRGIRLYPYNSRHGTVIYTPNDYSEGIGTLVRHNGHKLFPPKS